jgi:hypothetical protein
MDYEWDEENGAMKVTEFALMHASLVATPADTGAWLEAQNTVFHGFEAPIDNEVNPKAQKEKTDAWRLLV